MDMRIKLGHYSNSTKISSRGNSSNHLRKSGECQSAVGAQVEIMVGEMLKRSYT